MSNSSFTFETPSASELHIWRVPLSIEGSASKLLRLSQEEQDRANRLIVPQMRERFIISHFALRRILSRYLQSGPHAIDFDFSEHGKPQLREEKNQLRFNLSHSYDWALVAISFNVDIGVDLEKVRELHDIEALIRRFLSPHEADHLLSSGFEDLRPEFFRIWTAKEAYLKALGLGLSGELKNFDVVVGDNDLWIRHNGQKSNSWFLRSLLVAEGYVAAVAFEQQNCQIRYFDWRDDD